LSRGRTNKKTAVSHERNGGFKTLSNGKWQIGITNYQSQVRSSSREHNQRTTNLQAGFLTCTLPRDSFPSGADFSALDSGQNVSWISDPKAGTGAHSGATVADFNRVPIFKSRSTKPQDLQLYYVHFKERTQNYKTTQRKSSEKFSFFVCLTEF
jgi:hypothetical protein